MVSKISHAVLFAKQAHFFGLRTAVFKVKRHIDLFFFEEASVAGIFQQCFNCFHRREDAIRCPVIRALSCRPSNNNMLE